MLIRLGNCPLAYSQAGAESGVDSGAVGPGEARQPVLPQSLGAGQMLEPPGVCLPCPQALRWLTSPALRATWVS